MWLLLTLTLFSLMIWYSGLTALFFFLLPKTAVVYLPTALSVALRPLFPFQQAQYVQAFLPKPALFCMLFAGLSSINKSGTSLLLLCDSCSVLATLSSPPSSLLPQTLWQMWQELSPLSSCSVRLQWVSGHSFLPENNAADELARRRALLLPYAIPCSLSPLISCIYSSLLLDWRHTISSKFFDTQVPLISTEKLVLPHHACCVLSRLCCNKHSLLLSSSLQNWQNRESFLQRLRTFIPGHLSSHFALSSYERFCAGCSLVILCLFTSSGPGPGGVARLLGLRSSTMPPSLGRSRVTTTCQVFGLLALLL